VPVARSRRPGGGAPAGGMPGGHDWARGL